MSKLSLVAKEINSWKERRASGERKGRNRTEERKGKERKGKERKKERKRDSRGARTAGGVREKNVITQACTEE